MIGGQCPHPISHDSFQRFVTSLTRPVSAASGRSQFRTAIFSKLLLPLQCPVTLPGENRSTDQSPPCQRGVPRQRRGGGIPQSVSFPHGFVLSRSANCESLSQKSKIFASSLWQGSLWGAATKPPLSKGGASAPPRRGDSAGKACGTSYLFPIHFSLKTCPHWIFRNNKCLL